MTCPKLTTRFVRRKATQHMLQENAVKSNTQGHSLICRNGTSVLQTADRSHIYTHGNLARRIFCRALGHFGNDPILLSNRSAFAEPKQLTASLQRRYESMQTVILSKDIAGRASLMQR